MPVTRLEMGEELKHTSKSKSGQRKAGLRESSWPGRLCYALWARKAMTEFRKAERPEQFFHMLPISYSSFLFIGV